MQQNRQFTLLVRVCARSITSTSSRRISPGHCYQISQLRQLSSSCRRYASPTQRPSTQETSIQQPPAWIKHNEVSRPAAMWLAPEGSKFDQQQVLDQLPRLEDSYGNYPVVCFLVTPKLAHLFEEGHPFHSRAINTIYGASTRGELRQSIVAVVDALPILDYKTTYAPRSEIHGSEGVAMCISPGFDVIPAKDGDSSQPLISMTGKHPYFDGRHYVSISCKVPVANTTFINGQQNTMFMQNWRNLDSQQWLSENKRHKLSQVDVPLYKTATKKSNPLPVNMYSKIIKLTDPKVISHSMGNIVRQVRTIDGEELAASHELEKIVPDLLKGLQRSVPTGDIRVFALVYPPELGGEDAFKNRLWDGERKPKDAEGKFLTLLARGARLYRVTSGGAGWGKKAGLLSLEPITELGVPTEASGIPSFIFNQDEDIRMPGSADLFPPGHIIQFVATFHDAEGSRKDAISIKEAKQAATNPGRLTSHKWMDASRTQVFCIGNTVLPETHQYTSLEDVDGNSTQRDLANGATTSNLIFQMNQFGCLTSSALGFSTKYYSPSQKVQAQMKQGNTSFESALFDPNYKHSSLIELPNSYFVSRFSADGVVSFKAVREYSGSEELKGVSHVTAPIPLTRELTEQESISAASQRLRYIEMLQKDSYLAREQKPIRKQESGKLVRAISNEGSIITKFESTLKILEEPESSSDQQVESGALVRDREHTSHDVYAHEHAASAVTKTARARRRKIMTVQSFRVRSLISYKGLPELSRIVPGDTDAIMRWTPSKPALEKIEQTDDESFRVSYHWVTSEPVASRPILYGSAVDEDDGDRVPPEFRPFNETGDEEVKGVDRSIRKITNPIRSERADLRDLGLKSAVFRVYDAAAVNEDTEEDVDDAKEKKAVERLTQDLCDFD